MNLNAVVRRAIGAVNPQTTGTIQPSAGTYTTDAAGHRTPAYGAPLTVPMQVQALETRDLMQLDGLNVQGSTHKVYMTGQLQGIVRATGKGGDVVTLADGSVFLVTAVLEQWPDWCCAAVTLQR